MGKKGYLLLVILVVGLFCSGCGATDERQKDTEAPLNAVTTEAVIPIENSNYKNLYCLRGYSFCVIKKDFDVLEQIITQEECDYLRAKNENIDNFAAVSENSFILKKNSEYCYIACADTNITTSLSYSDTAEKFLDAFNNMSFVMENFGQTVLIDADTFSYNNDGNGNISVSCRLFGGSMEAKDHLGFIICLESNKGQSVFLNYGTSEHFTEDNIEYLFNSVAYSQEYEPAFSLLTEKKYLSENNDENEEMQSLIIKNRLFAPFITFKEQYLNELDYTRYYVAQNSFGMSAEVVIFNAPYEKEAKDILFNADFIKGFTDSESVYLSEFYSKEVEDGNNKCLVTYKPICAQLGRNGKIDDFTHIYAAKTKKIQDNRCMIYLYHFILPNKYLTSIGYLKEVVDDVPVVPLNIETKESDVVFKKCFGKKEEKSKETTEKTTENTTEDTTDTQHETTEDATTEESGIIIGF